MLTLSLHICSVYGHHVLFPRAEQFEMSRRQRLEEEIDLRPYLELLLGKARWIIGAGIIIAVAAAVVTMLAQDDYEATTLLVVVGDQDVVRFAPTILSVDGEQPLNALPQLAMSDEIMLELLNRDLINLDEEQSIAALRKRLTASSGDDRAIIRLVVQDPDPVAAAAVANAWAEIFTERANTIFGIADDSQLVFFEEQLAAADEDLRQAEEALLSFQEINRTVIISNTVQHQGTYQLALLEEIGKLDQVINQAELLKVQLVEGDSGFTMAEQVNAFTLQQNFASSRTASPFWLQVEGGDELVGETVEEQRAYLDRLLEYSAARKDSMEAQLTEMELEMLQLQRELQLAVSERDRLTRNHQITSEVYESLVRKVAEERISAQDQNNGLKIFSAASVPTRPVPSNALIMVGAAGVAGVIIAAGFFIMRFWWQQNDQAAS
jgi:uncharacterized protein involved in exopolysaccharide biosynthesis